MGRGRAKAKQTKVARELKYSSPPTNFDELQRELGKNEPSWTSSSRSDSDDAEDDDGYGYAVRR